MLTDYPLQMGSYLYQFRWQNITRLRVHSHMDFYYLFLFLFFILFFSSSIIITWKKHRAYDIFLACIFAIANIKFDYLCFSHWSCLRLFLLWFSLLSNSCMLVRDKYSVGYLFCHLFSHRAPTVLSSANRIHRICCCWCCFFFTLFLINVCSCCFCWCCWCCCHPLNIEPNMYSFVCSIKALI